MCPVQSPVEMINTGKKMHHQQKIMKCNTDTLVLTTDNVTSHSLVIDHFHQHYMRQITVGILNASSTLYTSSLFAVLIIGALLVMGCLSMPCRNHNNR